MFLSVHFCSHWAYFLGCPSMLSWPMFSFIFPKFVISFIVTVPSFCDLLLSFLSFCYLLLDVFSMNCDCDFFLWFITVLPLCDLILFFLPKINYHAFLLRFISGLSFSVISLISYFFKIFLIALFLSAQVIRFFPRTFFQYVSFFLSIFYQYLLIYFTTCLALKFLFVLLVMAPLHIRFLLSEDHG